MLLAARPPILLVRSFTTSLPTLAKKKDKMPPKKTVEAKKVALGRPGNKCARLLSSLRAGPDEPLQLELGRLRALQG